MANYANCTPTQHAYPYPFDQPFWTAQDQRYWIKMWNYGFRGVKEPYLCIIQNNRQGTWEQEYEEYLAGQTG